LASEPNLFICTTRSFIFRLSISISASSGRMIPRWRCVYKMQMQFFSRSAASFCSCVALQVRPRKPTRASVQLIFHRESARNEELRIRCALVSENVRYPKPFATSLALRPEAQLIRDYPIICRKQVPSRLSRSRSDEPNISSHFNWMSANEPVS